ncbi:MAG: aspartate/glutamate racemase family protein [Deltaproteobacteria bacterium]|nr:aspartate/glutamate racemase family protein [Deltaproteobacteria bacterium]
MNSQARIGLIIPSGNRLAEPQFQKYAPPGIGVHTTRLRMTGKWHKPLSELKESIAEAAAALSDTNPGVIVFNCTASSMEEGLKGEADVLDVIQKASGCAVVTTGQAITEALKLLRLKRIVLISPYVEKTNQQEVQFLREAGFEVIYDLGLGLPGGNDYINVTPERWKEITVQNARSEADGYLLSCTNTTMIEVIEELERDLKKPVVTSNQAALWAALKRLGVSERPKGLGQLFNAL